MGRIDVSDMAGKVAHCMTTKILVCSNTAWYLWNFRLSLMKELSGAGYEVVACAPVDEYVEKITAAGIRFIPISINRRGTNPITEILLIVRYYRMICTERPDIILTYTPKPNIYATLAARIFHVPVINNIAGLGFIFIQGGINSTIVRLLYKIALSGSKRVFFQNRDDMREFISCGLVKPDIATLLPGSGVDTNKFAPRPQPASKMSFNFLLVARMLWDKGIGEFVEAANQLHVTHPNARFYLLGPVDPGNPASIPPETLEAWNQEGIVTWLGSSDDIRDDIAKADCVVLPSYREGTPRSLLEAASMTKPIITTDEPGCREVVVHGVTGYLCRSHNASDLAEKMNSMLLISIEQRRNMGTRGREKMIHEFEERIIIDRYIRCINKILSN